MRLVLDTNITISGLLWRGAPGSLLDAAIARRVSLFTTTVLMNELAGVLGRPKFAARLSARKINLDDFLLDYATLANIVVPMDIAPTILADPTDDHVLAAALAAQADMIVSGDTHLLGLINFEGIPIVNSTIALNRIFG